MKVFDKRPLSLILCILLGAFVFFTLGGNIARLVISAIAVMIILISFFIKSLEKAQRIALVLFSFLIVIASLFSYVYFDLWFYADKRFDEISEIEGTVESFNFENSTKSLDLDADSIDGKAFSGYKIKVVLSEEDITNITVGTKLKFKASLVSLSLSKAELNSQYAEGFSAKAVQVKDLSVIGQEDTKLYHKISEYRDSLARRLIVYSNSESGGVLSALLLGNKDYLSEQTRLDFSRIGISHVLALSGMHLVIICYALSKILTVIGVNKSRRKIFEIVLTLFYMALTGFGVSVMRAGLMLIISALLFLACGSKDSVTNLFISVSIIVFIQPYAVFDISLWLSAFATLGIIVFATVESSIDPDKKYGKRIFKLASPFLSSAFAIIATLFISSVSFDTISSMSIISTAIFSPLILIFMHVGLIFLFTASFLPLGEIVIFIGNCVCDLAHYFSGFKFALLSAKFPLTGVLIIFVSILFFLFLVFEIRKKKLAIFLLLFLLVSTLFSSFIFTSNQISAFKFQYDATDGSERIFISENCEICLIDGAPLKNAKISQTINDLENRNILYLDNYFITSYNQESAQALNTLLSSIYVETIHLPFPKDEKQAEVLKQILELDERYSAYFSVYEEDDIITFEDFYLIPSYFDTNGKFAITICYKDEFYSYMSADMLHTSTAMHALKVMNGANAVIIGDIGSVGSKEFIYKLSDKTKIIYNKKTGLTDQILEYYKDRITIDPNCVIDLYVE